MNTSNLLLLVLIYFVVGVKLDECVSHVMLGEVSDSLATIWFRTNYAAQISIKYSSSMNPFICIKPPDDLHHATSSVETLPKNDYCATITISGLHHATTYNYEVLCNNHTAVSSHFTTMKPPNTPEKFSIIFSSCIHHGYQPFNVFKLIEEEHSPQVVLSLGDNIYADKPPLASNIEYTVEHYRSKYKLNFGDQHLQHMSQAIPFYMIWDDHDLINDYDEGPETQMYKNAKEAYMNYVGDRNPKPLIPNQLYYTFQIGQVDFFMMDTRTFRSRNDDEDSPSKTMLGTLQKEALKEWLLNSPAKIKVLVAGVMWNDYANRAVERPGHRSYLESWHIFKHERDEIFDFMDQHRIWNVILLSADAHWSGGFKVRKFFEFSVSPFANRDLPMTAAQGPEILFKHGNYERTPDPISAFGRLEFDTTLERPTATFDLFQMGLNHDKSLYRIVMETPETGELRTVMTSKDDELKHIEPEVNPASFDTIR